MSVDHYFNVGTAGEVWIQDRTDEESGAILAYLRTSSPVNILQMPYWFSLDGNAYSLRATDFNPEVGIWDYIIGVGVSDSRITFGFHIGETNTSEIDGPADFVINLYQGLQKGLIDVNVKGTWVKAEPYVKDGGVWRPAIPYVRAEGVWREVSSTGA